MLRLLSKALTIVQLEQVRFLTRSLGALRVVENFYPVLEAEPELQETM